MRIKLLTHFTLICSGVLHSLKPDFYIARKGKEPYKLFKKSENEHCNFYRGVRDNNIYFELKDGTPLVYEEYTRIPCSLTSQPSGEYTDYRPLDKCRRYDGLTISTTGLSYPCNSVKTLESLQPLSIFILSLSREKCDCKYTPASSPNAAHIIPAEHSVLALYERQKCDNIVQNELQLERPAVQDV